MSGIHRSGQPGQSDYRVTVYPSRTRLVLLTVGALAFVVIGVFMCVMVVRGDKGVPIFIAGLAAIVFFGFCLFYGLARLVVRKPVVVLDNTGLYDHASAISAGFLPWDQINGVLATDFGQQRMLSVSVTDTEAMLAQLGGFKRRAMRANIKLNGTPVNIPQVMLPIKVTELEKEIRRVLRNPAEDW